MSVVRSRAVGASAALLSALLLSCGGSPPTSGAAGAGDDPDAVDQTAGTEPGASEAAASDCGDGGIEGVVVEVEGLEGEERANRLAELAEEAGGTVSLYTALTDELAAAVEEAFTEEYGLALQVYRASGESISQRLLQEAAAGSPRADLVETGGTEMVAYSREGALAPYESPERSGLIEEAVVDDTWTGSRVQLFTPAWNTDLVEDPPSSWEDLADPRWDGRLAMETGNADWYMALTDYWSEQGKSEEEIQQLWRDIADGTFMVSGHSTMRELMVGGEFGASATLYSYMTDESMASGAPLAWEPPLSPLIIRTQGAGIVQCSPNPAGAVLLMDWWLSADGAQRLFVEADIDSVRQDLWDLGDAETYAIDVAEFVDEQQRWQDEFEQLTGLGEAAG